MNETLAVLAQCQKLGVTFRVEGDILRVRAPAPLPLALMESLRLHKAELLAHLRTGATGVSQAAPSPLASPAEIASEVERMVLLGARLRRGEIAAVCCARTGLACRDCQGVPCLGSTPTPETRGARE